MQRIRIHDIRSEEWFKKNYTPPRQIEDADINLDDLNAVFDDPEVTKIFATSILLLVFSFLSLKGRVVFRKLSFIN